MKDIAQERAKLNEKPLFTFDEILLNIKSESGFQIVKESVSSQEETNMFLGDVVSHKLNDELFKQFIDNYNLQKLTDLENFGSKYSVFVSPNKALLIIFKGSTYHSITTVVTNKVYEDIEMKDIVELLKSDFVPNTEGMCIEIVKHMHEYIFFPEADYCWEKVYNEVIDRFQPTVLTELLKDTVYKLYQGQYYYTNMLNSKPEVGEYFRRINIEGDGSYSKSALLVVRVADTYVELKVDSDIYFITGLKNFSYNFSNVKNYYAGVVNVINSAFCYYLRDDLIDNIIKGIKSEYDIRYLETSSNGHTKSFSISNNTCELCFMDMFGYRVSLEYKTTKDDSKSNVVFGTVLDIPYILAKAEEGSLPNSTLSILHCDLERIYHLCDDVQHDLLMSEMVSTEFANIMHDKISNNIERLCENWQVIYERLIEKK